MYYYYYYYYGLLVLPQKPAKLLAKQLQEREEYGNHPAGATGTHGNRRIRVHPQEDLFYIVFSDLPETAKYCEILRKMTEK